jgi:hypothetical protein
VNGHCGNGSRYTPDQFVESEQRACGVRDCRGGIYGMATVLATRGARCSCSRRGTWRLACRRARQRGVANGRDVRELPLAHRLRPVAHAARDAGGHRLRTRGHLQFYERHHDVGGAPSVPACRPRSASPPAIAGGARGGAGPHGESARRPARRWTAWPTTKPRRAPTPPRRPCRRVIRTGAGDGWCAPAPASPP